MKFWSASWAIYALSLLCLGFYLDTDIILFQEIRKILDMLNVLMLLFGLMAFMHIEIRTYWHRFSLYIILLALICMIYRLDLLSYYLPISIFQISMTIVMAYYILRYWNNAVFNKYVTAMIFFLWGAGKSVLSVFEITGSDIFFLNIIDASMSCLLNLSILTFYIKYTRLENGFTEHLFKVLIENTSDVLFYYKLSPYHAFEYVTPSITDLTGYNQEAFYKDPRFYINLVNKKYMDIIDDILNGRIRSDEGHIMEFQKKDGSTFWGEIKAVVISNEDEPFAVEGSIHDITAMKSAQIEQIKAKRSQDLLLSYISHELRSPVTSVVGYMTAMEDGIIKTEKEKKEAMEIISSKTILLKKLLDDLDQLSKMGANQFSFHFMMHSIDELVVSLEQEYDSIIKTTSKYSKIDYNIDKMKDASIVVDLDRINQVFSNLLNNAIKYSQEESEIIVVLEINKKIFSSKIKNTRGYIDPRDIPYLFDKFYKAGSFSSKTESGRGLGLAICKEIIDAHKGVIYCESEIGEGTTFTFNIPLYNES